MTVILSYVDDEGIDEHSESKEIADIDDSLNFNYTIFGPESTSLVETNSDTSSCDFIFS